MTASETIDRLVADGIVDAIIQRVKTGKEAEVFVVRKGDAFLAAKVYKERTTRTFKNNVGYQEGRAVRSTRDMRAMAKRTAYGVDKAENEWMHAEHDALVTVAAVGVRVPKPELFYEGILLMELVLAPDGQPAPRLIELAFTPEEALAHHREIIGMVIRMLMCDLIHGDLSPYNILLAWDGPTIIDMPQVVKAAHNSQAEKFLVRDVRNVTEHFAKFAPELKRRLNDGLTIWRKYERRELASDWWPDERPPEKEPVVRPPRLGEPRVHEPRVHEPKAQEPKLQERRSHEPRPANPRPIQTPRPPEQRPQEQRPHQQQRPQIPRPAPEQRAAAEARPPPQGPRPHDARPHEARPPDPRGPRQGPPSRHVDQRATQTPREVRSTRPGPRHGGGLQGPSSAPGATSHAAGKQGHAGNASTSHAQQTPRDGTSRFPAQTRRRPPR